MHQFMQVMRTTRIIRIRLTQAYQMMLDFYGLQFYNAQSGYVVRAPNWKERFRHLNQ